MNSIKSKKVASALRQLADKVEEGGLCVKDVEIRVNQYGLDERTFDGFMSYKKTGEMTVNIRLDLYNPDMDERGLF